ncbi:hypothetical protein PTTW11_01529 [Pyrenophora teres f. teres]|uniref:Uncharacterized protein n=1 Tax=Pyrenophora teres f. teres TaxID=97479 RepID=A0A6S6VRF2_9PLEO|nr:hypothetical protein PTTW11_01529 [Pyrenophora teres f. teres]
MESRCLGSLQPFTHLKRLTISENDFLGAPSPFAAPNDSPSPPRIAALLLKELESFTLLLAIEQRTAWNECIDDWVLIRDLVTDCKSSKLSLKEVTIKAHASTLEAPLLTAAFSQIGVQFNVIRDDQYNFEHLNNFEFLFLYSTYIFGLESFLTDHHLSDSILLYATYFVYDNNTNDKTFNPNNCLLDSILSCTIELCVKVSRSANTSTHLHITDMMNSKDNIITGANPTTTDSPTTTDNPGANSTVTRPDPSAHSEINKASAVQTPTEGIEDTVEEADVSAAPIEPVPEAKDVGKSDESIKSDQSDVSDQGYESGNVNHSSKGDDSNQSDDDPLASPFSTPKSEHVDDQSPVSDISEAEDGMDSAIAKDAASVPLAASKLEIVQPSKNGHVLPASPAVQVKKATVVTEDGKGQSQNSSVTLQEPPTPSRPSSSVPAHIRARAPHQYGLQTSRHMPPNELTRFNERHRSTWFNSPAYEPRRDTPDREQNARNSQLTAMKRELEEERAKNVRMRKSLEEEYKLKFDAASSDILNTFIREKVEAIMAKAHFEARNDDLNFREEKIQKIEVLLSEGQKRLVYDIEKKGGEPMSAVQTRHIRDEAKLSAEKRLADVEAKVSTEMDKLSAASKAQTTREECYKTLIRDSLLAELKKSTISLDKAEEIAEVEYRNGFAAGKEAGRKEVRETENQRSFLEGYRVSRHTHILLSKVRKGKIPSDSPELSFLYDPDHPYNLYTIGERLGRMGDGNVTAALPDGHTRNTAIEKKPRTSDKTDSTVQQQPEEPVRRMPPPRLTFAAELRGPSPMINGHVILANNAAAASSTRNGNVERPTVQVQEGESLIDLL